MKLRAAEKAFIKAAFGVDSYLKLDEFQQLIFVVARTEKRFAKAGDDAIAAIRDGLVKISEIRSGDADRLTAVLKGSSVAYDAYRRISGEIEARDVQARQNLTDEERSATEPYSSENIAKADAVTVGSPTTFAQHHRQIAQLALKYRLPSMFQDQVYVEAGGLMSYGAKFTDLFLRSATYVDKILKGAKPGDLPVEQPVSFELAVNLKTAKALGLTIPQSILLRADEVIE